MERLRRYRRSESVVPGSAFARRLKPVFVPKPERQSKSLLCRISCGRLSRLATPGLAIQKVGAQGRLFQNVE
jgi:hypothetical protein